MKRLLASPACINSIPACKRKSTYLLELDPNATSARRTMAVPRSTTRLATSITRALARPSAIVSQTRAFCRTTSLSAKDPLSDPPRGNPVVPDRGPPSPPKDEAVNLKDNRSPATFLGTTKRMPEFSLNDKVCLVTGAARGLGLTQAEGLLEAGATGENQ